MVFWGIEIKSGLPFTLRSENKNGRLRISQATLGDGLSSKKSNLQCNVGNNAPVFLCSLLPDKIESCPLDLLFEENDDVVFSVLGPRSIHVSGYYVPERHAHDESGSDSMGEDINVETDEDDESIYNSSDDEYDDDFVVGNDVIEFEESPPRGSGVKIELLSDDEPSMDEVNRRQVSKKRRLLTLEESVSGDEDGLPVSSGGKLSEDDATANQDEDHKKELDVVKLRKKTKKNTIDTSDSHENGADNLSNGPTSGTFGDQLSKDGEATADQDEGHKRDLDPQQTDDLKLRKKAKKVKKNARKTLSSDLTVGHSDEHLELSEEPPSEGRRDESDKKCTAKNTDDNHTDDHEVRKKKKKKKRNADGEKSKEVDQPSLISMTDNVEDSARGAHLPKKVARTFPNGLVIEEISMGKPDGKRASPGSKVSVHYIGKLKKNGEIFDSSVGSRPFKFRIGIGQAIEGWDVGINGMRVGDKRRLTIPPSMGYGSRGAGKIPPNAWLVFDVELVEVH